MNIPNLSQYTGPTPAYVYDLDLLDSTIAAAKAAAKGPREVVLHYAVKANHEPMIIKEIAKAGLGADCVSVGEVEHAVACGIDPSKIVYAGVGKTDRDIRRSLELGIGWFNVESVEEIDIINLIASEMDTTARIALRINPDIDAHTHHYITTGLSENKFGIENSQTEEAVAKVLDCSNLQLMGLHFHIGSQILTFEPFKLLCDKVNEMVPRLEKKFGIRLSTINIGGGLGIDYGNPDRNPVADFKSWLDAFRRNLTIRPEIEIHCEPGRALVAQCGTLLGRVIYVKHGLTKSFVIIDAGMNNLIRPALYGAAHLIENLSSTEPTEVVDVVGPICESADCFASNVSLPRCHRGDLIAIRSAGAYGASMASNYNMRPDAAVIARRGNSLKQI